MPIHLCAEHLIHIQTLSVQASLSTVSNRETRATLSADGTRLTLSHEGEEASVVLPINISPNRRSNASMILPAAPSKEVSLRVQLEQRPGINTGPLSGCAAENDNTVPWTAADLTSNSEISCRSCDSVIVPRGRIRAWKDLPSEGWAEMMDYWHCHRPTDHDTHDHSGLKKGYAADSRLIATAGVALIGAVDFILHPQDCDNVKITSPSSSSSSSSSSNHPISCSTCTSILGHQDPSTSGHKLSKLHLGISLSPSSDNNIKNDQQTPRSYHPSKWLSCLIFNASESQGVRKFLVDQPSSSNTSTSSSSSSSRMKLWLFTPDLTISSSAYPPDPVRVAKILWQDLPGRQQQRGQSRGNRDKGENQQNNENDEDEDDPNEAIISQRLNAQNLSEGELSLSEEDFRVLREELEKSSLWLPENARVFHTHTHTHLHSQSQNGGEQGEGKKDQQQQQKKKQEEWKVGLLLRFTKEDLL